MSPETAASCVVTCEHGGRDVPEGYQALFAGREALLAGHRGWDPGARELAAALARRLGCPLFAATTTRLLVDLNRSPDHPEVFSEVTRELPAGVRQALLAAHHRPYRAEVEAAVAERAAAGRCLHLSVHTFTPVWEGRRREVDVGLLFDPARAAEAALCRRLRDDLAARRCDLRVCFNEPYLGIDDGLTTHLRGRFAGDRYLGIELEVNQRFPLGEAAAWETLVADLADACAAVAAAPAR